MAKAHINRIGCEVLDAEYLTETVSQHNGVLGERGYSRITGCVPLVKLKVKPITDKYSPLETIEFEGFAFVKAGDRITATVDLTERINPRPSSVELHGSTLFDYDYVERSAKKTEKAIKLEILSKDWTSVVASFE